MKIKNDQILKFLQAHIDTSIETVAARMSDSLDFHDVHIGSLVTLVKKVYEAGYDNGFDDGVTAEEERAVTRAKESRD